MTTVTADLPAQKNAANWTIVLFSVLGVSVCSTPVAILSLSVFFIPLGEAMQWGRGEVAASLSILALAMAVATPFAGRLIDKLGVRPVLIVSLASYALLLALVPMMIETFGLWGFYAIYFAIGIVGAGSNTVAYTHLLSGWFDKTRGLVLGFAMSGIAIGAMIAPAIAAYLIGAYSWQTGFYGLALLPAIIGLPIAFLAIREAPKSSASAGESGELPGLTAAEAYKSRSFWVLFFVFLVVATCLHGAQLHLPSLLSDRGISTELSVAAFSLLFGVTAITRVIAGFMFDRMFAPLIGAVLFLMSCIGMALLIPEWSPLYYVAAAILIGIGTGAETDLLGYLTSRYYGRKAFGQIYGGLFAAFMIGSAIGPYVFGFGFDASGSYFTTLAIAVVGMAIACVLLFALPRFPKFESSAA